MKLFKAVVIVIVLAGIFSVFMYTTKNNQMVSVAAVGSSAGAQTEYDRPLCERLIRFGQVAFDRGQLLEAKHFFQKAITVDPGYRLAWKKYNMALLALISDRVESDPGFLPDSSSDSTFSSDAPHQNSTYKVNDDDDDGC
jgi:hypothetical protein